jgi:hypothetical protein
MTNHLYIVFCGTKEIYVAERDLVDMTREETINDLAAGEWGDINGRRFMVSSIIELETGADRTEEFIAAARLQMDSDRTPSRREWEADHKRDLQAAE